MPVCAICDSETFESRDGLYYCLTCGTQSQDIREEMVDEEATNCNIILAINTQKKSGPKRGYERVSGKPWIMHEAFQIIIKKQLEFLIQLGVDVKIKDIVGQIWFKYLRQTGIAFCSAMDNTIPSLGYVRKGILFRHNAQMLGKKVKKTKKRKCEKNEIDDEYLELSSQISKEEPYESKQSEHESSASDDGKETDQSMEDDDDDDDDPDNTVGSLIMNDNSYQRRLTMQTTITFSYLGLLYLKEPIFLSDILRWIKEGHFPYFNASTLLPDYMKFNDNDSTLFSPQALPMKEYVNRDLACIIKLLKLKPPNQDLRKYTSRFIMDLSLPAITHGLVNNLLEEQPFNSMRFRPDLEETAVAYIMVALKLCYGLDDSQHRTEADLAKHLESSESRDSLPVWKDWVSAARHCQAKTQASGVPWTPDELRQIRDPRAYTTFCKTDLYGSWSFRDREMLLGKQSVIGRQLKGGRKEYRDNCSEIFSNLTEGTSSTAPSVHIPTSFPNTCRHGNDSANADQEGSCFKDCLARRIPLQDFKLLCSSTKRERKYIKYLQLDVEGDTCHASFKFLLGVFAKHIHVKSQFLQCAIIKLEDSLIR